MTMTEAVLGARQKHKRSCEGGGSQGTLSSEPGWGSCLHRCLLPRLVCPGGHRCLYASLSLALSPPHLKSITAV